MVSLIVGKKGKGKTKILLDKANDQVSSVLGDIVFLDKNTKHMYELNNKIRLIVVPDFCVENTEEFTGFVSGIISQDHDLQVIYLDSFLAVAGLENAAPENFVKAIEKLECLSEKFHIDCVMSVSMDESELPEAIKSKVIVSL